MTVEAGSKEPYNRVSVFGGQLDSVWTGSTRSVGPGLQHVARVHHKRVGPWRGVYPAAICRLHLRG